MIKTAESASLESGDSISLVLPVYNEEENLPLIHEAIMKVLTSLQLPWEVIYVDDGSTDGSLRVLEELARQEPQKVRVVVLRRNFGQTAAISAGVDQAQGSIVILMDADLQNDPQDIPLMLEKIQQGFDVVSGWRKDRKDSFLTRNLPSQIANGLISFITGVHLHDYGCTLKAYRREVITGFRLYGEMHRFIPAYASSVGAKIVEIPVHHHPRRYGKAKYGLDRTLKVILDLFTVKFLIDYAAKPMRIFGGMGIGMVAASLIGLLFLAVRRIGFAISPFDSPLFIVSVMVMMMGFQSILMGLIAELLVRTYHESQQKPIYTIRRVVNGNCPAGSPEKFDQHANFTPK
jgi:glycosyltransferase involved in cell wall biosynthesis